MHSSSRSANPRILGKYQEYASQAHPYEKTLESRHGGLKQHAIVVLVGIVLAAVIVFFVFPDNTLIKSAATRLGSLVGKRPSAVSLPPDTELQQLTKRISEDNHWDPKRINLIVYYWGSLNNAQKQQIKQTTWFGEFSTLLGEKVIELDSKKRFKLDAESSNRDLIRTLAVVVGATGQNNNRNQAGQNQIAFANLVDNSKTAPTAKKSINRTDDTTQERHTDSNSDAGKQQIEPDKESESKQSNVNRIEDDTPASMDSDFNKIDSKSIAPDVTIAKAKKPKRLKNKRSWKKRPTNSHYQPTIAELYDVVNRYTTAYEEGNVKNILSLFSNDAKTNTQNTLNGIQKDYHALFSNTSDRQIFIQDLNWSYSKNYVKGTGTIKTILLSSVNSGVKSSSGKIQFIARKLNGEILITHLYSTNTFD